MVDTVTTTMGNDNDDWEVAVDTGEFDKRLEQQEQDRATKQESTLSTENNDDNRNSSYNNLMNSNKPIRILKRPTSQIQLPVTNDIINSNTISTTIVSNNTNNNNNLPFSNNISSSTPVPIISIIPRNQNKDSINSSQTINSSNSLSSQSTKPPIKTYEQRELEYRLARLRIMGEEESSTKDDDDDINNNNNNPIIDSTTITSDEPTTTTSSSTTSLTSTKTSNNNSVSSLQSHSTPGSYASNLYNLNNTSSNPGPIHFNTNSTGPFSQQQYRGAYSTLYPQMPLTPSVHYPTTTLYMPSSSSNYPIHSSLNSWYHYQQQQNPYGTQQYGHPQ
ncbi:unnamed protein product [Rotaria sp. Silwood2]|nr:unnamed protein product [Rotaria sp. Silwood2]CAF2689586.1 unnamed protein product [Rotaria sp. Silwood2]CAF3106304.1 unnamed protein product [Rotaria sp. Silwood2]CAF3892551.1 unnamed protein product [Rotaria sp. Silwood2]CAF3993650.1 unnamed protein product [Rotaria sp. Silwood2]